jgi:beta-glucanase (GH16 family)
MACVLDVGCRCLFSRMAILRRNRHYGKYRSGTVDWSPESIRFFVDRKLYAQVTPARLPPNRRWVFAHPFFLILNLAVGGDWPGKPDDSTSFPQTMLVDWVEVWRADGVNDDRAHDSRTGTPSERLRSRLSSTTVVNSLRSCSGS